MIFAAPTRLERVVAEGVLIPGQRPRMQSKVELAGLKIPLEMSKVPDLCKKHVANAKRWQHPKVCSA